MRRLSTATGLVIALLALGWLEVREAARAAPTPSDLTERRIDEAPMQSLLSSAAPLEDPEALARPRCVADVLALDAMPGLEGIAAAFERGMPGDDGALGEYLRALVALRIGTSTDAALEVLAWAERAAPEQAAVLLEGLSRSAGAKDHRVAARLLALGVNTEGDEAVRAAALDALRTQRELDAGARGALSTLALDVTSEAVAWHATRALGSVMAESHKESGEVEPYWDELEKIARTSEQAAVRALALEAPMHADTILPKDKIEKLLALLPNEPHRDARELAIFQLGLTASPEDALDAMRRAFHAEYDECVRWAIVRFSVRAAGERALPLLDHFAQVDESFVADVADFRALFAAGFNDFEQIWLRMPERHNCAVEDGEPHGGEL
jgi:hypothetical protein